jgi:thymidylate synthase
MEAASLTWVGGDSHIYVNQIDKIKEQLGRESAPGCDVRINFERELKEIDDFTLDAVSFTGYEHQGFLNIPVAV